MKVRTGDQTGAPATAAGVGMEQKGCGRQKVADRTAAVEIRELIGQARFGT